MTPQQIKAVEGRARCLHDETNVELALDRMAQAITLDLQDKNPLVIGILHGGLITAAKLLSRLTFPLQSDYLHATRYRGSTSGKDMQWKAFPKESLKDRVILLVDGILDVGTTIELISNYCREQESTSVHAAVLVDKQHERKSQGVKADYVGIEVDDHYLFGYGMDYKGYLRKAPGIYAIADEDR